ncbi:hypothetical protein [Xanthobacter sediminis]
MALPVWPVAVPYASERDRWGLKRFRDPVETEMEGGNIRVRRRPGDNLMVMSWGRDLHPSEFTAFRTFVEDTLHWGVSRFSMAVSLDGRTYEIRAVQMQPKTLEYSKPSALLVGVKFSLYVFPASVVS